MFFGKIFLEDACIHKRDKYVFRDMSVREETEKLTLMYFKAYLKSRKKVSIAKIFFLGIQLFCTYGFLSLFYCHKGVLNYHRLIYSTLRDIIVKFVNLGFDNKRSLKIPQLGIVQKYELSQVTLLVI